MERIPEGEGGGVASVQGCQWGYVQTLHTDLMALICQTSGERERCAGLICWLGLIQGWWWALLKMLVRRCILPATKRKKTRRKPKPSLELVEQTSDEASKVSGNCVDST